MVAPIGENNHIIPSAYNHAELSNNIPNSLSNGYDLRTGTAPTGYSISSAQSNQNNFVGSHGRVLNNPNNGATNNQLAAIRSSNASVLPASLPIPPGKRAKLSIEMWHSPEHISTRNKMVEDIISLLKTRRPNATNEFYEKLPYMAKRLEDALYQAASTFEVYSNNETLKNRVKQAVESKCGNKQ